MATEQELMVCGNCGCIGVPRVYLTEDGKFEAWECIASNGCGVIMRADEWLEVEEEDEDGSDT